MAPKRLVTALVTRRFAASSERVFDAWLDPVAITKWFGPGLGEVVRVEVDGRIGGAFSFVQRRNGADIDHTGRYLEMNRPSRLVFTWGIAPAADEGSRVVVDIVPEGEGCVATLRHELDPEWEDFLDRTRGAWTKMLDAMAEALKS